jgi:hypothetical protein
LQVVSAGAPLADRPSQSVATAKVDQAIAKGVPEHARLPAFVDDQTY